MHWSGSCSLRSAYTAAKDGFRKQQTSEVRYDSTSAIPTALSAAIYESLSWACTKRNQLDPCQWIQTIKLFYLTTSSESSVIRRPIGLAEDEPQPKMDFGKFRDTAELADITVCVDGRDFRLHRFPLYVRSDFFRALARNSLATDGERVELADFPGGADTFELVTSFCYNIDVDVTTKNVCQLRCAAEFLQVIRVRD